jgi:hypothetical protein
MPTGEQKQMSLSAQPVTTYVDPLPGSITQLRALGWSGPEWSDQNPRYINTAPAGEQPDGGTVLQGIVGTDPLHGEWFTNTRILAANLANTFLEAFKYGYTAAAETFTDEIGNKDVVPAGALMVLQVQGTSAYVPPAPPVVVPILQFGEFYGLCPWTVTNPDGTTSTQMLPTWSKGAATTLQAGKSKPDGGPGANVLTPGEVIPVDIYTVQALGYGWITGSAQQS